MMIEGRAVVISGDNVDTDIMYTGAYLNIDDPEQMKPYLFEGYDPRLRSELGADAIIVTGWNFGIGSSREHVPQAMKAWGVRCVLGPSFARIFRRNCVNLGLPDLECFGGGRGGETRLDDQDRHGDRRGRGRRPPLPGAGGRPVRAQAAGLRRPRPLGAA